MKNSRVKNRSFLTVYNKISNKLIVYCKENFSESLLSKYKRAHDVFKNRSFYYRGDVQEVINWIIEDELKVAFEEDNPTEKYSKFIIDLAIESSLIEAERHFSEYRDYYQLIYDLGKYEYFYFKNFEGQSYVNSNEYQVMMNQKHPNRIAERQKIKDGVSNEKQKTNQGKKVLAQENWGATLDLLKDFTDDEKFLLLNILFKYRFEISMVEYMKLIRIVGSYGDISIFSDSPKNSKSYSQVNKGLDYYTSPKKKNALLQNLIVKLEALNLKSIIPYLKTQAVVVKRK